MHLLVTGGAGFIGSHLIERILARATASGESLSIVCLDNFNDYYDPSFKRKNIESFAGDARVKIIEQSFCDPAAILELFKQHRFERVIHLGAYAGVRPSVQNPLVYQENNVRGTLVLLEAARTYPVERFVFSSSSTVYGRGAKVPFSEDQPLGVPMSPYGATKRACEILGQTYLDLHRVPFVCVRPFSVYGPRLRPDLAMTIFTDAIYHGKRVPLFGDGSFRRDFTHVTDICDGILATATADGVVGEMINLGHSEPIEMRRLIALLEEAVGRKANIDFLPETPGDMPVTCADLSKAKRLLGYEPTMPIEDGVKEYVAWWKQTYGRG